MSTVVMAECNDNNKDAIDRKHQHQHHRPYECNVADKQGHDRNDTRMMIRTTMVRRRRRQQEQEQQQPPQLRQQPQLQQQQQHHVTGSTAASSWMMMEDMTALLLGCRPRRGRPLLLQQRRNRIRPNWEVTPLKFNETAAATTTTTLPRRKRRLNLLWEIGFLSFCCYLPLVNAQVPSLAPASNSTTFMPTFPLSVAPSSSKAPSSPPTVSQAPSPLPTSPPTSSPTVSSAPTSTPTESGQPTSTPTLSHIPTIHPTAAPSVSAPPTGTPSAAPTGIPTAMPSDTPTNLPTFSEISVESSTFRQKFLLSVPTFNLTDQSLLTDLYESYTDLFHDNPSRVETNCSIDAQVFFSCTVNDPDCLVRNLTTPIEVLFLTDVDYTCTWTSVLTEVNGSALDFETFLANNPDPVLEDMQDRDLPVLALFRARPVPKEMPTIRPTITPRPTTGAPTTAAPSISANPTRTPHPTQMPTITSRPTASWKPSGIPSVSPTKSLAPTITRAPTFPPTMGSGTPSEIPSLQPSRRPTKNPTKAPTKRPTKAPTKNPTKSPALPTSLQESLNSGDSKQTNTIIISVVVGVCVATIAALVAWFWRRRKTSDPYFFKHQHPVMAGDPRQTHQHLGNGSATAMEPWAATGGASASASNKELSPPDVNSDIGAAVVSPSESLVSRQSLVSAGNSGLGEESDIEADNTRNLQDEFDQYKDQNLEQLRSDVEGNVSGFEGIMSAAVTKALMGDDYPQEELSSELTWGCPADSTGAEIEASALFEVNDWLKRKESATVDQKRAFMQDILNRMVSSVRFGVLPAEDASRTIHESAALLGLQLAHPLSTTTIIISGMRKTSGASHMKAVLRDFGDLDTVAAASGQRGFGIVRFRNPKSVDRVMRRYRSGEIVIQDVAIQMKFLTPSGQVESGKG